MRMMEASLYPVIPHLHAERHNREKKSMSDYVHDGPRSKMSVENTTIESRLMFCVCYVLFLFRAVLSRLMPWREQAFFRTIPAPGVDLQGGKLRGERDGGLVVHGSVTGISSGGAGRILPFPRRFGIRCRPRSGGERPQGHH